MSNASADAEYKIHITRRQKGREDEWESEWMPFGHTMPGSLGPWLSGVLGRMDDAATGQKHVPYVGEG